MSFFVAGGTVPPGSPSYVERAADRELLDALLAGEFCYVLNSRQMGKSSLAVRTITKLGEAGVCTAFVDLTRIGGTTITPEQWYAGFLLETGRALGLRGEAAAWLKDHRDVGPAQRLLSFLQEAALVRIESPVVLMVDEIDAVRSLPFNTDELFAGLRQLHNGRASDPALARLTVCLLGAALPSDLIRDPRATPFNVGRRVELRDFTPVEAAPFAGVVGEVALANVLRWTGGHPFLTQAICADLPEGGDVDALVRERYLDARAREADTNLADVGRRLLGEGDPNVKDEDRATTLAVYERMMRGKPVPDEEGNPETARIKMSGVARVENGQLRVRNRIYVGAFGREWVRDNTPGQELRRQRRAFYKGVLRTGLVASLVLAVVLTLAIAAVGNAREAQRQRDRAEALRQRAEYDAYVASMQTMAPRDAEGDHYGVRRTLARLKDDPSRGWEWDYWSRAVDRGATRLDWDGTSSSFTEAASPTSPFIAVADGDALTVYDAATGRLLRRVGLSHSLGQAWHPSLFRDGRRALLMNAPGDRLVVVDMATGRILRHREFAAPLLSCVISWVISVDERDGSGDGFTLVVERRPELGGEPRLCRLDLGTLRTTPARSLEARSMSDVWSMWLESSGRYLACYGEDARQGRFVSVRRTNDLREIWRIPIHRPGRTLAFAPHGAEVLIDDGRALVRFDTATGRRLGTLPRHGTIYNVQYAPDGRRLLVSASGGIEEYGLAAPGPRLLRAIPAVEGAQYLSGARLLLDATPDLMVLDPPGRRPPSEVHLPGAPFSAASQSADGRVVLDGADRLLTIIGERPLASPTAQMGCRHGIDASGRFLSGQVGSRYKVTDLARGHSFWLPLPKSQQWTAFAADPEGSRVALVATSTSLGVYDAANGALVETLDGLSIPDSVRFSNDGRWLAAGDLEGNVAVWDARTWRRVASGRLGRFAVDSLAFSDDGTRVAAGTSDGIGTLDVRDGSSIRVDGALQAVDAVAWSHDGRRLASAGEDRKVRLWDPATVRDLGAIGAHETKIVAVWFTKDDRTLCSVDAGGTLKLWRTEERP